jgi:hypothetical protein
MEDSAADTWRVVGFDVGYSNLAMVVCDIGTDDCGVRGTPFSKMTDLRTLSCDDADCMFERHDRKGGHLMHHFIESVDAWLRTADQIVIEAQPITSSHKDIEQLLLVYIKQRYSVPLNKPKDHVKLIAPQSMHAHFGMSDKKVERRKEIVEITRAYLEDQVDFRMAKQKDHLADAVGFILYYSKALMPDVMFHKRTNPFNKFRLNDS